MHSLVAPSACARVCLAYHSTLLPRRWGGTATNHVLAGSR